MQIDIHARIVFISDEMMIFSGFTDDDVASAQVVSHTINLHLPSPLQDDEHFRIVCVHILNFWLMI